MGYYDRRWQLYFDEAFVAVQQNRDFDQKEFDSAAGEWEQQWVSQLTTAPLNPTTFPADPLTVSRLIFTKYFK